MYLYFSRHLERLGITKTSKLVEVQRPDLVASFLGQTASQTKVCIERAEGGVLFLDEAYRLKVDSEKDYLDGSHAPR